MTDYLTTIDHKEIFPNYDIKKPKSYTKRQTVKVIIENDERKIALVTNPVHKMYTLPGGGADIYDLVAEAKRECIEETGYEVEILGEVGKTRELRDRDAKDYITTCFYARVIRKVVGDFRTEDEKSNNMTTKWIKIEKVVSLFNSQKVKVKMGELGFYNTAFNVFRDKIFIDEYLKMMVSSNYSQGNRFEILD